MRMLRAHSAKFYIVLQVAAQLLIGTAVFLSVPEMTQKIWCLALVGIGVFECFRSQGRSWLYVFCSSMLSAIFINGPESGFLMTIGVSSILIQSLQIQEKPLDPEARAQKVVLCLLCGLLMISTTLREQSVGRVFMLTFVFLITLDWPARGILSSFKQLETTRNSLKALAFVATSLLVPLVYAPGEEWVGYSLFAMAFLSLWGEKKEIGCYLLFLGVSWITPELQIFLPAVAVLSLGEKWSSMLLGLITLYALMLGKYAFEPEMQIGVFVCGGIFLGWMLSDRSLPKPKEHRARDYFAISFGIILLAVTAVTMSIAAEFFEPKMEAIGIAIAAIVVEALRRTIAPLKKLSFHKALTKTLLELLIFIPILKTQEQRATRKPVNGLEGFTSIREVASKYFENLFFGLSVFAVILWSVVIWCYYNI